MAEKGFAIKTERLILRPLERNDLDTAHEYAGDVENTKYMIHLPNNTIKETEQFLQRIAAEWEKDNPSFYEYAIILGGKHIGAVSVYLDESRQEGELGWLISKMHQGNGYGTEAAKAVLDWAINELKVKKIVAYCDYRNEPSFHVMHKIGLCLERDDGTRRYKGSDIDIPELMYSLTVE
ncbi:GNAT family N-acetyltransferase [Desulfitobacterium chlororespirans]|uniref:Protein N-acetyltransferase, RimJ/RimL family n=1 Tax=Desulfitobacterium chlororespirans DSM 11544 TaxID=1121395 RepID=A0A1M7T9Y3_9FIRM|nr:GNAT family N-acetyltransferase [Desulfitobacterium chlororespirans]SHN67509.1 Protein N-acetyltransferase, RimJ/RimL family [Desulfitobacterium chlororespirans DSM 11544]